MPKRLVVVVSQSPSQNPAKRQLEETIVTELMLQPGIDVTVIPNLYDLRTDSTGLLALQGISGNLVVCSWLYQRAAHWILDRNGIRGQCGQTLLISSSDDDDQEDESEEEQPAKSRVSDSRELPQRKIYCLDLRVANEAGPFLEEIRRILDESNAPVLQIGGQGQATAAQHQRMDSPTNTTALALDGTGLQQTASNNGARDAASGAVQRIDGDAGRRWYPVIDYSRCTNCMECIDFCLFGVYGVDKVETILVEQPDNCRKGCPACSRVCPENAIIFPQHKTPVIAGADEVGASLKIDLSQLFGAPQQGKSAIEVAALERDEQLVLAGRDAVGLSIGVSSRHAGRRDEPRDELDELVDQLDELDL